MRAALASLRSLVVWLLAWLYMAAAGALCLPWLALTGRMGFPYAAGRLGCRFLLRLAGVRVVEHGPRPADRAQLYMANHQSNLDPPILLAHLPGYVSFLAKKELFSLPILGTILRVAGLVPVDRADREGARASIARAAEALRAGRPFLIFPEGQRSRGGQLLELKKGPFFLAEQAASPVVALRLEGVGALMPPGAWRIRPGAVHLYYHPPILPSEWASAPDPRAALAALIRARLSGPAGTEPPTDASSNK